MSVETIERTDNPANEPGKGAPERGAADQAKPVETYGVACPACGGSLGVQEGERSVCCEYCGSALVVVDPAGVRSFAMDPRITAGKARLTALHHLAEETGGRIRARHASIVDLRLVHVPFWRMHGRLVGWLAGNEIHRRQVEVLRPDGHGGERLVMTTNEERRPFAKLVFKHIDWSAPACSLRRLGLRGIAFRSRFIRWRPFDHRLGDEGSFAFPMISPGQAERDAFAYLTNLCAPTGAEVRASRFDLLGSEFSLYYYPVYLLRYRHGRRIYTITVDGNDGSVLRGETPPRRQADLRTFFFVPALFALLAGLWLPAVAIAAGIVYVRDLVQARGMMPPHRWLAARLDRWFGGELR
ncbi:MAG: hypothetical protein JW876_06140 [Candidatus Krumholzibacteriota bacterium]|nr:hypothetical protein [Candidatus Krumholzibacteriota bacterium]